MNTYLVNMHFPFYVDDHIIIVYNDICLNNRYRIK